MKVQDRLEAGRRSASYRYMKTRRGGASIERTPREREGGRERGREGERERGRGRGREAGGGGGGEVEVLLTAYIKGGREGEREGGREGEGGFHNKRVS